MSTKTTFKRVALVAVASLGFGVLSSVTPASAATLTGSVSPVRVTYTGTTQDTTPHAQISWTSATVHAGTDTATVTITTAPTAAALVQIRVASDIGSALVAFDAAGTNGSAKLGTASASAGIALTNQTTTNGKLAIVANTSGSYGGYLTVYRAGVERDTVNFTFTTRGAVASYTAAVTAASLSPSATGTHSVTLLDAGGFTTQPLTVDSFANTVTGGITGTTAYAVTASVLTSGVYALASTSLADGVASQTYTAGSSVNVIGSYITTPAGTLGALAAQTLAVTTDATTIDATAVTAYAVTVPADAGTQTGTLAAGTLATPVRTGTTTVTLSVTGTASTVHRFSAAVSAGTLNGVAAGTTVYTNATASSLGKVALTYTLAGNATLLGATLTINQVNVANTAVALTTLVVTQTAAAAVAGSITNNVGASLVRALATTTSVEVTVADQFGENLGSGWTVQAFRSTTLLSTGTTNASGVATVTINPLTTVVTGGTETYTYKASRPGIAEITATDTTVVTYTTTGGITSMSTAITGQTGASILTPVLHTTAATALTYLPAVRVVTMGYADDAAGDGNYRVSTAALAVTAASTAVQFTTTNVPANSTTYTADAGSAICSAAVFAAELCDWNVGVSTITVAAGASVYAYATTTGVHTITATSGDKTTTMKFYGYNVETDYYTLSATADSASITTGQTGVVTINVKDVFGNVVDTTGSLMTATASGKVRLAGQALTQTVDTGVLGTFSFTVLADATAGSGTITIAPTTTGAAAWATTYVKPAGAADPVKSVTLTFTVTGATLKTVDDVAAAVEAAVASIKAQAAIDKASLEAQIAANKIATDAAIAASQAAAVAAAEAAADAAAEAIDAGNNAYDSANAATDAADAATAAAQQAGEDAVAAAEAAGAAAVEAAQSAQDAAAEATDAATAATDAANAAAEAADASTAAAQDAADAVAAYLLRYQRWCRL